MLVDDHQMVRSALRAAIEQTEDIRVVAEAASGEEALDEASGLAPHVVLMDVSMPGIGGLEATRKLVRKLPGTKVIVVSAHLQEPYPSRMLEAGARGYIGKDSRIADVVRAIRRVHAGGRYVAMEVAESLSARLMPGGPASPFERLSEREMQVMLMILEAESLPSIAERLRLSPKTVSTYHGRILDKLACRNDVAMTRMAMRYGILDDAMAPAELGGD